jgi:hypothetical protein
LLKGKQTSEKGAVVKVAPFLEFIKI